MLAIGFIAAYKNRGTGSRRDVLIVPRKYISKYLRFISRRVSLLKVLFWSMDMDIVLKPCFHSNCVLLAGFGNGGQSLRRPANNTGDTIVQSLTFDGLVIRH